ncbi:hypothetical protein CBLAS_1842 [Campylobacter blaseri]|uniref:Uncharacterized protein n=1 Tax=Campylobacter blaseri TaxID=2042961 RepID=A0A2P8R3L6_9BACT|nr:hypothetical protein [Campylobacter blaseri]PSM53078.1 hypothetical protein CQ405_00560 [Campylobacter blaseri]PSM54545.1 hypothetical protein CRN67_00560 [Campylobacter blaseri]QKF86985.1 hypothetical protein CBLAS_1842 [Campylobacter blaseri]
MYLLTIRQDNYSTIIGVFETLESGREFAKKLPGYKYLIEDGFEYETLDYKAFSDYVEVHYKTNILPFTKFMFRSENEIYIDWSKVVNLDETQNKIVGTHTLVDAYFVNNDEVKSYIEKRENLYKKVKKVLENLGYEVDRSYKGSEDGEAILYKKSGSKDWHFLTHLDPMFVEECPSKNEEISKYVQDLLI